MHQLHDHFIPHEGNNHVPKALRHKNLLAYSAVIVGLKILLVVLPAVLPTDLLYSSSITEGNIITLTNQTRAGAGLHPLTANAKLSGAAQARANDMMAQQYFSHTGPDGSRAWSWIRGAGYAYKHAGENLALYFDTAESVHSGWLASPSHRANILSDKYTEIGVGVVQGAFEGYPTFLVVQFFGAPLVPVAEAVPAETTQGEASAPQAETEKAAAPQPPPIEQEEIKTQGKAEEIVKATSSPASDRVSETAPVASAEEDAPASTEEPTQPVGATSADEESGVQATVLGTGANPPEITSVNIRPSGHGFFVQAAVTGATEVRVLNQIHISSLEQRVPGIWEGWIGAQGERNEWRLLARSGDGAEAVMPIADFLPDADVAAMYGGVEPSRPSGFPGWFNYPNIRTAIYGLYLYLVVFLIAAMMLKYFIRIHVQRWSVIAHTFAVIALAILMLVL